MLSPQNLETVRRHVEAETNHQMEETLATLTEDCVFDDRALDKIWHGREGARAYYEMWWSAFAVKPETSNRWAAEEGLLIVETHFVGNHKGEWLGIQPTGRDVSVPMMILVTCEDGLMTGEKFYWDLAGLMKQIGVDAPWPSA